MPSYVAMIRGVGPENPNMRGEKLRGAFEELGLANVRPFLTSGNVLFESRITDTAKLEKQIEAGLPKLLDFQRDVFVRSKADLERLVNANPFGELQHQNAGKTYLTVTFFKSTPKNLPKLPYTPDNKHFNIICDVNGALCTVIDLSHGQTTDMMAWFERQYGKSITTRTWNTVSRLLAKLS